MFRALDSLAPTGTNAFGLRCRHLRLEAAILCALPRLLSLFPETDSQSRQQCRSKRGGFSNGGANYRGAKDVCLKLHEAVVGGGAPVNAKFAHRIARVALHGIEEIGNLIGNAFHCRPGDVAGACASG